VSASSSQIPHAYSTRRFAI